MNIGKYLTYYAKKWPHKRAVVAPLKKRFLGKQGYVHLSFRELDQRSDAYARALLNEGVACGDKVLVFIRPTIEFSVAIFALFKMGAVPVFIDPGMGLKNLIVAIKKVAPKVLIAVPLIHIIKLFLPKVFSSIRHQFVCGQNDLILSRSLYKLSRSISLKEASNWPDFEAKKLAAILYTSGGTGPPKGVEYTQEIFHFQIKSLKELFSLGHEDIDCPGFPLFSLFTICMGMTSCIPPLNPSKPSSVNPKLLVEHLIDHSISFGAGSPAIWEKVANYCLEKGIVLEKLKFLAMFGAPVSLELHEKFRGILPNGDTFTPYGATEVLPVSNICGSEIVKKHKVKMNAGKGTCVGQLAPSMQVQIIKINDRPIENMSEVENCRPNEVGEIVIAGPAVTPRYYQNQRDDRLAKIWDDKKLWHRMGDLGYMDEDLNLWFCGRKAHRVELGDKLICSVSCEAIFNNHPKVKRSALIGQKDGGNVAMVVECLDSSVKLSPSFKSELQDLAQKYEHTKNIKQFYLHQNFPVDVRHNIKIDRLKLNEFFNGRV